MLQFCMPRPLIRSVRLPETLVQQTDMQGIKRKIRPILIGILLMSGITVGFFIFRCPSEMTVSIGKFESKDAGLRASIKVLADEVNRCPKSTDYHIIWVGPDPDENQRVDRRGLWYLRRSEWIGYEHDVNSGISGRKYIVDDEAIKAVAGKGGTLEDFAQYDQGERK